MRKRLIVTGASGFVAGSVIRQAGEAWETHALSSRQPPAMLPGVCWHVLDALEAGQAGRIFREVRPDAVIHTAAVANIDYCEAHREEAARANVVLTETVATLCRECGSRLVHCSTDTVFDGERGNYRECDTPRAVNFYAETKIAAERIVSAALETAVVARLALVVGLPMLGAGNAFLPKMLAQLERGEEIGVTDNEFRTPIDVVTLGRALLELAGNDFRGCIHLAGSERVNRFDLTRRIAARFGCPTDRIVVRHAADPRRAPRPRDVSLDVTLARATLRTPLPALDAALDLIVATAARATPPLL